MKTAVLWGLVLVVLGGAAHAALPPQAQRLVEFKAVLEHSGLLAVFPPGQYIERVEYVKSSHYRVMTAKCQLDVALKDLPRPEGMVGPRRFEVQPGQVACTQ